MDNLLDYVGYTNTPPPLILDCDDYLTDSSVSETGVDGNLNYDVESAPPPEPAPPKPNIDTDGDS